MSSVVMNMALYILYPYPNSTSLCRKVKERSFVGITRILMPASLQKKVAAQEGLAQVLRILSQQNTALPSHVCPSVTGRTFQLFSIGQGFGPYKPYIL